MVLYENDIIWTSDTTQKHKSCVHEKPANGAQTIKLFHCGFDDVFITTLTQHVVFPMHHSAPPPFITMTCSNKRANMPRKQRVVSYQQDSEIPQQNGMVTAARWEALMVCFREPSAPRRIPVSG